MSEEKIAVHCPTKEDYDRLMEAYDKKLWVRKGGDKTQDYYIWYYESETCVDFRDYFEYCDRQRYIDEGRTIITVDEAIQKLFPEERDRSKTYVKVSTEEEKDFALEFYRKKGFDIRCISPIDGGQVYIQKLSFRNYFSNYRTPGEIDITKEVLSQMPKKDEIIIKVDIATKSFLSLKKNKPMTMTTLSQEIFERFLKSNKTKVIEAVEKVEETKEEMDELLKPVNGLVDSVNFAKRLLESAYEKQDKQAIKERLKNIQDINTIFDDKLFEQLKTILKAINKMLAKK